MLNKFISFKQNYKDQIVLIANYLIVLNAFLLPISYDSAKIVFQIILVLFLFSENVKEKIIYALKNKVVQAILMIIFIHFLWLFTSNYIDLALFRISKLKYLLFIIVYISMIRDDFKETILNAFILSVVISEIISISMVLGYNIPFIKVIGVGDYVPFFLTYTQYVLLLATSLGLILYKLLTSQISITQKSIYSIFFIISSINIFMMQSKLGYLLYIFSIITTILFISKKHLTYKNTIATIITVFITLSIAFHYSTNFKNKLVNMKAQTYDAFVHNKYTGATGIRLGIHAFSLPIIKENLLFGVGTMNHIEAIKLEIDNSNLTHLERRHIKQPFISKPITSFNHLHSEFLEFLIQFGIIGLFVLLYFFYAIYKENTTNEYLNLLRTIILVNFFFYCGVSHFFLIYPVMHLFVLLTALSMNTYYSKSNNTINYPSQKNLFGNH